MLCFPMNALLNSNHPTTQPTHSTPFPHSQNRTPRNPRKTNTLAHSSQNIGGIGASVPERESGKITSRQQAPEPALSLPADPPKLGSTSLSSAHGHARS